MAKELCEKLKLRLNDYPVLLQQRLAASELGKHAIRKAGLLARLMLQPAKGENIFWSKNCILNFIDDDDRNSIMPMLGKAVNPEHAFRTSAFFHFHYRILSGFAFQIVNNPKMAEIILADFEKKIVPAIGQPSVVEGPSRTWEENNRKLIIDYPGTRQHGYIHLILA